MGESYLPDKEKLTPSDQEGKTPYPGAPAKSSETVRFVSPPAPPYDKELDIRTRAGNIVALAQSGSNFPKTAEVLIREARLWESYLRGT